MVTSLMRHLQAEELTAASILVISGLPTPSSMREPPQIGSIVTRNPDRARRNRLASPNVLASSNKEVKIPGTERNVRCLTCGRKKKKCSCHLRVLDAEGSEESQ